MKNAAIETQHESGEVKTYALGNIPDYRKPVIEELIIATELFTDGFDTPENLDGVAVRIFDAIVSGNLIDAHLRLKSQPEN